MPRLHFDLVVDDKGSLVVKQFTDKTSQYMHSAAGSVQGVVRSLTSMQGILAGAGLSYGVGQIIKTADNYQNLHGRLKLVTSSTEQLAQVERDLFAASQQSRTGYGQTIDLYTRIARSTQELNISDRQRLEITDTINKSLVVSGASAEAANAALIQLGQGFASGTLRGEELNSVLEQAPRLAEAIADGMGVTVGKLRELGKEGKLTAEAVTAALLSQSASIQKEFNQMPKTVGQAMTVMNNSIGHLISGADQAGGATAILADHIIDVSERIDEWTAANEDLIKQKVPEYIDGIKDSLQSIVDIYNGLPDGITGPAGVGLITKILTGSTPFGLGAALGTFLGNKASAYQTERMRDYATAPNSMFEEYLGPVPDIEEMEQYKKWMEQKRQLIAEWEELDRQAAAVFQKQTQTDFEKNFVGPLLPEKATPLSISAAAEKDSKELKKLLEANSRYYEQAATLRDEVGIALQRDEESRELAKISQQYDELREKAVIAYGSIEGGIDNIISAEQEFDRQEKAALDAAKKKYADMRTGVKDIEKLRAGSHAAYLATLTDEQKAVADVQDTYHAFREAVVSDFTLSREEVFALLDGLDKKEAEALAGLKKNHFDASKRIEKAWDHTWDNVQDGLADWVREGEYDLDNFADAFADMLADMLAGWVRTMAEMQAASVLGIKIKADGSLDFALASLGQLGGIGTALAGVKDLAGGALGAGFSAAGVTWDFLTGKTYSTVAASNAALPYASSSSYGLDIAAMNATGSVQAFSAGLEAATVDMQYAVANFFDETLSMGNTASAIGNMSPAQFGGVLQGGVEFVSYGLSTGDWEEAAARGVAQGLTTWALMSNPYTAPLALIDALAGGAIVDTIWDTFGWNDPKYPRVMSYGQMYYDQDKGGFSPITKDSRDIRDTWSKYANKIDTPHSGYSTQVNKIIEAVDDQVTGMIEALPDALEDRVVQYFEKTPIDITFHQKNEQVFNNWAKMFSEQVNEALMTAYAKATQDVYLSDLMVSPLAEYISNFSKITDALKKIDASDLSAQEKFAAMNSLFATIDQFTSSVAALSGDAVDVLTPLLQIHSGFEANKKIAGELGVSVDKLSEAYQKQTNALIGSGTEQIAINLFSIAEGVERLHTGIARAKAAGFADLAEQYAESLEYLNDVMWEQLARLASGGIDQRTQDAVDSLAQLATASRWFSDRATIFAGFDLGFEEADANVFSAYKDRFRSEFADLYAVLYPSNDLEKQLSSVQEQYNQHVAILRALADQGSLLGTTFDDALSMINSAAEQQAQDIINNYIDPVTAAWKQGMDSLLFSDLAPVQSWEQFTGRYDELLAGARSGDAAAVSDLFSFLQSEILPFAQQYRDDYAGFYSGIMGDLSEVRNNSVTVDLSKVDLSPNTILALASAIQERKQEITVNLNVDAQKLASIVAIAGPTNPEVLKLFEQLVPNG